MKNAVEIAGSLSAPSKMPGWGYGLPAIKSCNIGSKLAKVPGTPCSKCYALRGHYQFPVVVSAQEHRMNSVTDPRWEDAMVHMIGRKRELYFRWHDSGDLLSVEHLTKICNIARRLPNYKFWLPTQERGILREWQRQYGEFPSNLTVRVSTAKVDHEPVRQGWLTSSVHKLKPAQGHECPARHQGNKCGDCRACWDSSIENVSYHAH